MKNIDFKDITPFYLIGRWRVKDKLLSKSDPGSVFVHAQEHCFYENGDLRLTSSEEILGRWEITFSAEVIRNPLITFTVKEEKTNAIITRLLVSPEGQMQLTLYMATGLELVLIKN